MNSLIITGGMFYESFACDFCKKNTFDFIIGVDRGMAYAKCLGIKPDYVVGDFDSYKGELDVSIPIERYPSHKDYTDTHLAIEKAIDLGSDSITILCGSGGRMDHFMSNLCMLAMCCEKGIRAYMVDPWNRIQMIRSGITLEKQKQFGTYISLIPYSEQVTGITLTGFKYPLQKATLTNQISLGTSNELIEEEGRIELQSGNLLIIESKDAQMV